MRSDGGRRGKREDFSLDSLLEDSGRRSKRKGSRLQTLDSSGLCNRKGFFNEKSSLKISRSPITLQKTRFLLVAKARISPVSCLFVCLSTNNNIIIN
jgi:hypothetical protein